MKGRLKRDLQNDKALRTLFQKNLGDFLRQKRLEAGMKQITIAKVVGFKNAQFISNIERGACSTPWYVLKIMIEQYNLDKMEFLTYFHQLQMNYCKLFLFDDIKSKKIMSGRRK